MGRASSRKKRGQPIDNRGEVGRAVMARGTCMQLLATDLRVQEHYRQWVLRQEQHRRNGPPAWVRSKADIDHAIEANTRADIDDLAAVLRTMDVPWRWCADALVRAYFPTMRYNERHPDKPRVMQVSPGFAGFKELAVGRKPKRQGQEVAKWVRWWYRARIKSPKDAIHQLEREDAAAHPEIHRGSEKTRESSRSRVYDGIDEAVGLLNRPLGKDEAL